MFYIKFKQLNFFKYIFSAAEVPPCGAGGGGVTKQPVLNRCGD